MYNPKFYTKRGRLNRYALACGYTEVARSKDDEKYRSVVLEMSGSVLHVTTYDRETNSRTQFCTNRISEARKVFSQEVKKRDLEFTV